MQRRRRKSKAIKACELEKTEVVAMVMSHI
jgi:hypothetical protein